MPSTTLCDYQVLQDTPFTLDASTVNREVTLNFEMPSDFEHGTNVRMPILAFAIRPFETSSINFYLNERKIIDFEFSESKTRTIFEPFKASTAFPMWANIPDPVPLRIFLQSGRAELQNIIMWYQIWR